MVLEEILISMQITEDLQLNLRIVNLSQTLDKMFQHKYVLDIIHLKKIYMVLVQEILACLLLGKQMDPEEIAIFTKILVDLLFQMITQNIWEKVINFYKI